MGDFHKDVRIRSAGKMPSGITTCQLTVPAAIMQMGVLKIGDKMSVLFDSLTRTITYTMVDGDDND